MNPCIETNGTVTIIHSNLPEGLLREFSWPITFFVIMLFVLPLWVSLQDGHLHPQAILLVTAFFVFGFYYTRHNTLQYRYRIAFDTAAKTIEIQYENKLQQWYNKTFFIKDRTYAFGDVKHFFQQGEYFTKGHCYPYCYQIRTIFSNNYFMLMLRDKEEFEQVTVFLSTHFAIRTAADY